MSPGTSPTWDLSSLPYTVRHSERYTAGQEDLVCLAHHLNTELLCVRAFGCWPDNCWMGQVACCLPRAVHPHSLGPSVYRFLNLTRPTTEKEQAMITVCDSSGQAGVTQPQVTSLDLGWLA